MEIAVLKDWVIVIFGFLGIGAVLIFVTLLIIIYRKIAPIIDAARKTATNVGHTSAVVSNAIMQPIAKVQGFTAGVRKAAEVIASMSKRGGKDGE